MKLKSFFSIFIIIIYVSCSTAQKNLFEAIQKNNFEKVQISILDGADINALCEGYSLELLNLTYLPQSIPVKGEIHNKFGWRTSPFGHGRDFHSGIDIAAPCGTEIVATAEGIVECAGWEGGYGLMIKIKHNYNLETVYSHCVKLSVNAGQKVKRGEIIAFVGQTGAVAHDQCHYEIRLNNIPIDPYRFIEFNPKKIIKCTALHYAVSLGNSEIAEILLKRGANPQARDELGFTPINIAQATGKKDMEELLQKYINNY